MATIKSFEEIEACKGLAISRKKYFGSFSKDYSLRDQINRATGSIMDNIAEGFERGGTKEFIQFVAIAKGSAGEVRSQLYRARDRKHLNDEQTNILIDNTNKVSRMINGFMMYLRDSKRKGMKVHGAELLSRATSNLSPRTSNL
jgi:four helix bundle protein